MASRRHLRSASRNHGCAVRHSLNTYDRPAFAVAGPADWNLLSDELRHRALSADRQKNKI